MTTYSVSNASGLNSALDKAKSGDTIALSGGNYGNVKISGAKFSSDVKITSAGSSKATFSSIDVVNSTHVVFDNLKLSGSSSATGFEAHSSTSSITLQNSDLMNFKIGIYVSSSNNFKALNNDLTNIRYDGIDVGMTNTVLIQNNEIHMNGTGDSHRDAIQFFNQGTKAPSSNVTIKGNLITSNDGVTHGIYFGNYDTKGSNTAEFYKNITVEGNTLKTGQMLAIAFGGSQDVKIRNNVVVGSDDFSSKKTVHIPMIIVDKDARNVTVSGNTVVKAPAIGDDANNWKIVGTLNNTGSKIVALGASVADATSASASTLSASAETATTASKMVAVTTLSSLGNGVADEFRFNASKTSETSKIAVDFAEGDTIVLNKYAGGTFADVVGGNIVHNSSDGIYVKIDALTDLQELVSSSKALSAKVSGDTLTIDIDQGSTTHHLELAGLGQAYQDTFDASLF
jgi:parallel beta-helix repeat protein